MTSAATRLSGMSIATALCFGLAATPALAAPMFLKIKGVDGESKDDKHKNEIEILSWSWGATQPSTGGGGGGGMGAGKVSKVESLTIKQTTAAAQGEKGGTEDINIGVGELQEAPAPGEAEITLKGEAAEEARKRPGRVKYGDITLKQGTAEATGGVQVAAGDVNADGRSEPVASLIPSAEVVSPRDVASGQATGKRQHKPITITKEWDANTPLLRAGAPPPQGTLRVKVKMPWLACRVGARLPELELADSATAYKFKDVLVTGCASPTSAGGRPMESISFNYAKIEF